MIESFGPRPTATSGPAASLQNGQSGEKIFHRPPTRVLPAEPVDRTAPTGPRPAFKHTYLEQAAAFWPDEPDPPVPRIAHDVPEKAPSPTPAPRAEDTRAAVRPESGETEPSVDLRR